MRWASMVRAAIALVVVCCFAYFCACSWGPGTSAPAHAPTPRETPAAAAFDAYVGAYRTDDGATLVTNGHGHLVNLQNDSIRQLFPTSTPGRFIVGTAYQRADPKQADVFFHVVAGRADYLTETPVGGPTLTARRLQFKETEVKVPAADAMLAATITEPLSPGPHAGIVIVHGSGPGPRIDYGVWVGLYASLGLTVLAYDKRGNGSSTGVYPGEFPTDASLGIYADDAAAALRHLASWPGVDPKRVGFHGGSQGGWTVPLAMQRFPTAAFAVLVSSPAVTVGQQGVWADFSSGSTRLPSRSAAEMDDQVRAEHSGYDPLPALAATTQPILWLNGAVDRQVPTAVNAEVLKRLNKPQFDVELLPGVDHGMLENPGGLTSGDDTATKLATGLFDKIAAWLARHA